MSSDNILEPVTPTSSQVCGGPGGNFNKIQITSENESKRTRLRKSVSSDVILGGIQQTSCEEDGEECPVGGLRYPGDCTRKSPSYQDTTESDLPELAPVSLNIDPGI